MTDKLTPERSVRLLRAKAGELEGMVHDYVSTPHHLGGLPPPQDMALAADIALIATLLADHIERAEAVQAEVWRLAAEQKGMELHLVRLDEKVLTPNDSMAEHIRQPTDEELAEAREWRRANFPGIKE